MSRRSRVRHCSVARTLDLVGERWTFLVVRDAFFGVRRFDQFGQNLGIAPNILTSRLRHLTACGVFERCRYQERPERFEYRLTEKGRDLYPVAAALMRWGDRWLAGAAGPPLLLFHRDADDHAISPVLTCADCGEEVRAREVRFEDGPGAGAARRRRLRTRTTVRLRA